MVTYKDIARLSGLSHSTVARVINGDPCVKAGNREKVLEIIESLNYTPNMMASSLKSNNSKIVGYSISDIRNPFFMKIAYMLQNVLHDHNYNLLVSFADGTPEEEFKNIRTLLSARVRCLVFTPKHVNNDLATFLTHHNSVGIQLFARAYDEIDSLVVNDEQGAYNAVREFLRHGHRRILLLDCPGELPAPRTVGYQRAFIDGGMMPDKSFIKSLEAGDVNTESFIKIIQTLKPSAILCVASLLQRHVLEALKALELRVKDDVSLIFYDDSDIAEYLGITAIGHDTEMISQKICECVLDHIEKERKEQPSHAVMETLYIPRDSVKALL